MQINENPVTSQKMRKVVIDLHWLNWNDVGGIQTLAWALIHYLAELEVDSIELLIICNNEIALRVSELEEYKLSRIKLFNTDKEFSKSSLLFSKFSSKGSASEKIFNRRIENPESIRIVSINGYVAPFLMNLDNILVIPDIQHIYLPHFFSKEEINWREKNIKRSLKNSKKIIAISKFAKNQIQAHYSIPEEIIEVVYLGPNKGRTGFSEKTQDKMNIPDSPFFFYPATSWEHKNHCILIEAYSDIKCQYPNFPKLILSGRKTKFYGKIMETIAQTNLSDQITHIGVLSSESLEYMYQNAEAMVFPSLYEGFGLPVLEAQYLHCPVICSQIDPLLEICKDSVEYFDPTSKEDIKNKMVQVWENGPLRNKLIVKGQFNSSRFDISYFCSEIINLAIHE